MKQNSYKFQREHRLLNSRDYSRVFSKAIKLNNSVFTLLARKNSLDHPRLGLIVSKKNQKLASQRNQTKRLLREGFRLTQSQLANFDIVLLTRRDVALRNKTDIIKHRNELFARFSKRYPKN